MQSTEELAPRLYGLPKIHKDTVLLPPIISTIGFSSYYLARYIAFLLQKYIVGTATYRYVRHISWKNSRSESVCMTVWLALMWCHYSLEYRYDMLQNYLKKKISRHYLNTR